MPTSDITQSNPMKTNAGFNARVYRSYSSRFVYCLISATYFFMCAPSFAGDNITTTKNVQLICDYKNEKVDFFDFDIKNKNFIKRNETGIEKLTPILDKFIGKKIINTENNTYVYGYFLSLDERTQQIAPDPIGKAYVNRSDLYCLSTKGLFN